MCYNTFSQILYPFTDADGMDIGMEELEEFLPSHEQVPTDYDLRIKNAAKHILENCCGIISTLSLTENIKRDAANLLADESLLIFTNNLFNNVDDVDPEGYIKYAPDEEDLMFYARLIKYNVNPIAYLKNITLPKVWKNRLSANGIRILRDMKFYQNMLDSISSSSDEESQNCK
jgi:hypothetical protein